MPLHDVSPGQPPSTELDYVEITVSVTVTSTSSTSPNDVIIGDTITLDGVQRVKVEFWAPAVQAPSVAGGDIVIELWDGSTDLGRIGFLQSGSTTPALATIKGERFLTPSQGSHTFKVRAFCTTGSGEVFAGGGGANANPSAFLRITEA